MPDPIRQPDYATPEFVAWLRAIVHAAVWRCNESDNARTNTPQGEKVHP